MMIPHHACPQLWRHIKSQCIRMLMRISRAVTAIQYAVIHEEVPRPNVARQRSLATTLHLDCEVIALLCFPYVLLCHRLRKHGVRQINCMLTGRDLKYLAVATAPNTSNGARLTDFVMRCHSSGLLHHCCLSWCIQIRFHSPFRIRSPVSPR